MKTIIHIDEINTTDLPIGMENSSIQALRIEKLTSYEFHTDRFLPDRVGYLIGNTDIGGLVHPDGLGFEELFVASYWLSPVIRGSLPPFRLQTLSESAFAPETVVAYDQRLGLADGITKTTMTFDDGRSYRSELFASQADSNLICLRLTNTGSQRLDWRIQLPVPEGGTCHLYNPHRIHAVTPTSSFTQLAWVVWSDHALALFNDLPEATLSIEPGDVACFHLALSTGRQSYDYTEAASASVAVQPEFNTRKEQHEAAFNSLWSQAPVIDLPDERVESLFYRSLYWLFSASGSPHALPQETPLASVKPWKGVAFTYGFGWGIYAYTMLGMEARARAMAIQAWKPAALQRNAQTYLDRIKDCDTEFFMKPGAGPRFEEVFPALDRKHFLMPEDRSPAKYPSALSFAHQVAISGDGRMRRCNQRHIDGFAAGFYYRLDRQFQDSAYRKQVVYPALRGTAEFWRNLLEWDDEAEGYLTPPLHSVSENLTEVSVLDAVLSALWNLRMAAQMADELEVDQDLRRTWEAYADHLIIPSNDTVYLECHGQDALRKDDGYFGVRSSMHVGFPFQQLVRMLDGVMVEQSLTQSLASNGNLNGMISFVASGFAASAATWGKGDLWLQYLKRNFATLDPESGALCEVEGRHPYFHTSYAAYICAVLNALFLPDDSGADLFHGIPESWGRAAFYNMSTQGGGRISARWDGEKAVSTHTVPPHQATTS